MIDRAFLRRSQSEHTAKVAIDLMSRWKRVNADLATDSDLFRLVVRVPLK